MKKILYFFVALHLSLLSYRDNFADVDPDLKDKIIPNPSSVTYLGDSIEGEGFLDYILGFARDTMFALLSLLAIGMFLFIGGRLVVARGNPEEFKKALMSFVYAAVGLFVVAFAWALVRMVAGINL